MRTWEYQSKSSPGTTYTVTHADNNMLGCDCRGWTIKKPGKPRKCTHIDDVIKKEGFTIAIKNDEYVFVTNGDEDETTRKVLTPAANDSIIDVVSGETTSMTIVTDTTTTQVEGQLACAMVEGRFGHVLDEDGYVIPEKFEKTFATGEWVMDEKLDGHRCQIKKTGAVLEMTLRSIPAIPKQIVDGFATMPDGIYDGEILVPGGISTDVPNLKLQGELIFAVFDILEIIGQPTMHLQQIERRGILETAMAGANGAVLMVTQYDVTWANVKAIWDRGGEGVMLKRKTSIYRMGYRTADWIKVKSLEHHTITVTAFEADSLGPTAIVIGIMADGTPVRCKNKNNKELAETAANPAAYIGRRLVMQCQQRVRGTKRLRHPMFDHWAGEGE